MASGGIHRQREPRREACARNLEKGLHPNGHAPAAIEKLYRCSFEIDILNSLLEANFDEGLGKAEAKAAVVGPVAPALPLKSEIMSRLEQLRRIADVSPRASILEAWVLVEEAAGKSGFVQGASIPRVNPFLFVEELIRLGKLPTGSSALIEQLRKLRNQAAHLPDFSITQDEADRYLELAAKASELILSVE